MRSTCVFAILTALVVSMPLGALAACGNGVKEAGESCDGADLGGETCATLTGGFVQGGTLTCNADCTLNMADCRRVFIESLVPATGGGKNRCQLEWTAVGTTASGGATRRSCAEGDSGCDRDGQFNSSCTFALQVCLNVPDPKVAGCPFVSSAGKVFRVQVLQPSVNANATAVKAVQDAFLSLVTSIPGVTGNEGSNDVSFSPPITTFGCGRGLVAVPVRGTVGRARPGKLKLRARSSDATGRIRAIGNLTLICNP